MQRNPLLPAIRQYPLRLRVASFTFSRETPWARTSLHFQQRVQDWPNIMYKTHRTAAKTSIPAEIARRSSKLGLVGGGAHPIVESVCAHVFDQAIVDQVRVLSRTERRLIERKELLVFPFELPQRLGNP